MALIHTDGTWQLVHGAVTLDAPVAATARTWRYPEDAFLERRLPEPVAAALLREQPQEIDGFKVITPRSTPNATFHRLAGHATWSDTTMVWPRTEWDVSPAKPMSSQHRVITDSRSTPTGTQY